MRKSLAIPEVIFLIAKNLEKRCPYFRFTFIAGASLVTPEWVI
jgi:hypothetical protein